MSTAARTTERKAIEQLAKCLIYFERLQALRMSAEDAAEARAAENHIRAIIESNGYGIYSTTEKGVRICKMKNRVVE